MKWFIGCSGFHYKEWKNEFYPPKLPQRSWFQYYSERFNTLELNTTFYRFPRVHALQNWYNISPAEYRFAVKAPRLITHYKQFNDCERLLTDFYGTIVEGLKDKLGPVLYQFPPAFYYSEERMMRIVNALAKDLLNVVEFRHASWWKKSVYAELAKHAVIFCGQSHPGLPDDAIINNEVAYYRFHGIEKRYYSSYDDEFLQKVTDKLRKSRKVKTAYVYFNNTATMAAIHNASWIKEYLGA